MSNKREIKKDIQALVELVITDAFELSVTLKNDDDRQKALDVIVEAANLHNRLIGMVNHPDGKDNPKIVKKYFKQIKHDLLLGCDKAYDNLTKIVPGN